MTTLDEISSFVYFHATRLLYLATWKGPQIIVGNVMFISRFMICRTIQSVWQLLDHERWWWWEIKWDSCEIRTISLFGNPILWVNFLVKFLFWPQNIFSFSKLPQPTSPNHNFKIRDSYGTIKRFDLAKDFLRWRRYVFSCIHSGQGGVFFRKIKYCQRIKFTFLPVFELQYKQISRIIDRLVTGKWYFNPNACSFYFCLYFNIDRWFFFHILC